LIGDFFLGRRSGGACRQHAEIQAHQTILPGVNGHGAGASWRTMKLFRRPLLEQQRLVQLEAMLSQRSGDLFHALAQVIELITA
jgi:hypothetical protein